jgi:hypothetical protein
MAPTNGRLLLAISNDDGLMPVGASAMSQVRKARMRFLGIGESADLAALYLRLAGHEVRVFIGYPLCRDTLAGLIERVIDWKAELNWIRAAGPDGASLRTVDRALGRLRSWYQVLPLRLRHVGPFQEAHRLGFLAKHTRTCPHN